MIRCRNWVFCSEIIFAAEWCVVQRNSDSLPKLCQLQRISIRCRNWVVCNEFVIRCRNWVFYSELAFAAELCVVQRNCDSLSKLCQLRRINIRCRIVCCAANCDSLPKLCRLQRVNNSLSNGVFCGELAIRCRSWVGCSEIVIRCRNCVVCSALTIRCRSWVGCSEIVIRCRNCGASSETVFRCLQRNSSRCQIGQPAANQFSLSISTISLLGRNDLNASNNFMVWWCKMWNTWMWTYELFK